MQFSARKKVIFKVDNINEINIQTENPISAVTKNILSSFLANSFKVFTKAVLIFYSSTPLMHLHIVLDLEIYNAIPIYLP